MNTTLTVLPLENIFPDDSQPRKFFDQKAMDELVESVQQQGILQPIMVRPAGTIDLPKDRAGQTIYKIVCGERRYRAAEAAGLTEIPCVVRELSDDEVLEIQIVENLQRKDVNPMEEAIREANEAAGKKAQKAAKSKSEMTHQTSDITVYVASTYSKFTRIKGNRDINQRKVMKMVKDIKHGVNLLPDFPILVSEEGAKLRVIDGQHRLEAAMETKQPVYYIIRKEQLELVKMARLNSLQEKWKATDFINCYIEQGISDYRKLQDFIDTYGTPISMSVRLLANGVVTDGSGPDNMEGFRNGKFRVKHYKQAVEIVETCRLFEASKYWNTRPFMVAITRLLQADLCDFVELQAKFSENPAALTVHSDFKGYLVNLEQIYNKGYKNRRTIY